MRSTLLFLLLSLTLLRSANAQSQQQLREPSPNQKFAAVYDHHAQPPFKIVETASGNQVATMTTGQVSQYGLDVSWSSDSKLLIVLVEWRWYTEIDIFRLVGGHFVRAEGPVAHSENLTPDRWIAPNKVRLYGDVDTYTLIISDHTAKFGR